MPQGQQGQRGAWLRCAIAGIGAVICTSTVGCEGLDKSKDTRAPINNKQAVPGLPGTPMLPASGMGASGIKTGQQYGSYGAGAGNAMQTPGSSTGFGTAPVAGRGATSTTYNRDMNAGTAGYVVPTATYPPPGAASPQGPMIPSVGPQGAGIQQPAGIAATAPNWGASNGSTSGAGTGASIPPAPDLSLGPVPPPPPSGPGLSSNYGPITPPAAPLSPNR